MKLFLILFFSIFTLTSVTFAQNRSSNFYNEKGQLITDTTLTISPYLIEQISEIEDTLGNLIKENYRYFFYPSTHSRFGDKPMPLMKCIIYLKLSNDGRIIESDVKKIFFSQFIDSSMIYIYTKNLINKKIPSNNKLTNNIIYIPIDFNEEFERSNIDYYLEIKNNIFTINWNATADDYFEFNENYKKISFNEYTNELNSIKFYQIKPDSTYDYYELRIFSGGIRPPVLRCRNYIKKLLTYKSFYPESRDLDSIICSGGQASKRPKRISMYRPTTECHFSCEYVVLVNNKDTTIISKKEKLVEFIGKIDNISEAILVAELKGYSILNKHFKMLENDIYTNYRITKDGFEFLVYSGDEIIGYDLWQVIVENRILKIERLGIIEK